MNKDIAIFQTGPIHLFLGTGIMHIWEIRDNYDIVLIVDSTYKSNIYFQKIISLPFIVDVYYVETCGIIQRHRSINKISKLAVSKYRPKIIYLHNRYYFYNQYLLHYARTLVPKSSRVFYQNGRATFNIVNDIQARIAEQKINIIYKFKLNLRLKIFVSFVICVKNFMSWNVNYKILPWIILGRVFSPKLNPVYGTVLSDRIASTSDDTQLMIQYNEEEGEVFRKLGCKNIVIQEHPCVKNSREIYKFLGCSADESNTILILPSYGFLSIKLMGDNYDNVVDKITSCWIRIIADLKSKYNDFSISIKLHPQSLNDNAWIEIVNRLRNSFPIIKILPPNLPAEMYILASKIIVGDISTTLWWASFFSNKTVYSYDVFDYICGSEMSKYNNIIYVSNNTFNNTVGNK